MKSVNVIFILEKSNQSLVVWSEIPALVFFVESLTTLKHCYSK